jgi:hypothetical protein
LIIIAVELLNNFLKGTRMITPSETGPIKDSVWCIKDRYINAYLFRGRESHLLIDAGLFR